MKHAIIRAYWRMSRATVSMYLLEPRSGICHPVTAEMCFASPAHAAIAWMRCKLGHVIGDGQPRPPVTALPLWQQEGQG